LQREPQLNPVEAEFGARKLSVIGGGIARGSLIAGAHLVVRADRLGGAASPVVRPRKDDRIGCSVVDVGEMRARRRGIVEVAQGNPSGHEMGICPVIFIGRRCGVAHHLIGVLELALIEQLAGENTPLPPPFVGVLKRHGFRRRRQHQPRRVLKPILTHHPANTA